MKPSSAFRLLAALATIALPLGAQSSGQPAKSAAPAAPADTGSLPVDRIVAIVGDRAITWNEVMEMLNQRRASGMQIPSDSAAQMVLAKQIVEEEIDNEVLVQKAQAEKVEVTDADLTSQVDQRFKAARDQFKSDQEFTNALRAGGFGTSEEFRRFLIDQARKRALTEKFVQKMKQDGKIVQVAVTDDDVNEAFEKNRTQLPKRPATVTFRQIIVAPEASAAAKAVAKAKAESLLVEIKKGADFELI